LRSQGGRTSAAWPSKVEEITDEHKLRRKIKKLSVRFGPEFLNAIVQNEADRQEGLIIMLQHLKKLCKRSKMKEKATMMANVTVKINNQTDSANGHGCIKCGLST